MSKNSTKRKKEKKSSEAVGEVRGVWRKWSRRIITGELRLVPLNPRSELESHYSTLILASPEKESAKFWLAIQKIMFGFIITPAFLNYWIHNDRTAAPPDLKNSHFCAFFLPHSDSEIQIKS